MPYVENSFSSFSSSNLQDPPASQLFAISFLIRPALARFILPSSPLARINVWRVSCRTDSTVPIGDLSLRRLRGASPCSPFRTSKSS